MTSFDLSRLGRACCVALLAIAVLTLIYAGQATAAAALSADARAAALVAAMTLDEKLTLLHGSIPVLNPHPPADAIPAAGYIPGIPRLGIPAIHETDAGLGVANGREMRVGDVATALPSALLLAATWNPQIAYEAGQVLGAEARAKGFEIVLNGGANLAREPRNGRLFEYPGEDPLLAGIVAGEAVRGIQSKGVISTVKHFALNDQETGRRVLDTKIAEGAARESDLLAFQIAIDRGRPGAVMTSYNMINGRYAGENAWLLDAVLKRDWKFDGWVMSDWGAVPNTEAAALSGLDQESGDELDVIFFEHVAFSDRLKASVAQGRIPIARVDDMVRRYLRALIAHGIFDRHDPANQTIDFAAHAEVTQNEAEQGIVLLKNERRMLPLSKATRSMAVIGGHADIGVLSGGGSSQVRPVGGAALAVKVETGPAGTFIERVYDPSPPLRALRAELPAATVRYDDGSNRAAAAQLAASADVAIVFAEEWRSEGRDRDSLALPDGQDALISAVAAANPNTVVVLETGGPVLMPWSGKVRAVLEAWYPGQRGGEAIARILTGAVNPSGRLPVTFPAGEQQLPRPVLDGLARVTARPDFDHDSDIKAPRFTVDYDIEGSDVGYRWYAAKGLTPLFPFGFGLSYGRVEYSNLKVNGGSTISAHLTVTNTEERAIVAVPQVYATVAGRLATRLVGWQRIALRPHETRDVEIIADPRLLSSFDTAAGQWRMAAGDVTVAAGDYASDARLRATAMLTALVLPP